MNLYTGNVLVVDLCDGSHEVEFLDEEMVNKKIGGAAINIELYKKHEDGSPIVIGTGAFTATLVPGCSLGVVTAKSPLTGSLVHIPVPFYWGLDQKLSGFDFIVLKGEADKPLYLWLHDEVAEVREAGEVWGKDVWSAVDELKGKVGDELAQFLTIGPAGEAGSLRAQFAYNYWASADRWAIGKLFGDKKLKSVAIRGMGIIDVEDPEGFRDKCLELHEKCKGSEILGRHGVEEICELSGKAGVKDAIKGFIHRHRGCYGCPFACHTYVKYNEPPTEMKSTDVREPGTLLTDPQALEMMVSSGIEPEVVLRMVEFGVRQGIDPICLAEIMINSGKQTLDELQSVVVERMTMGKEVEKVPGPLGIEVDKGVDALPFSPWVSSFGGNTDLREWKKSCVLGSITGICPVFMQAFHVIDEEVISELLSLGMGVELGAQEILDIGNEL